VSKIEKVLLAIIAAGILAAIVRTDAIAPADQTSQSPPQRTAAEKAADDSRFEGCKSKLKTAERLDVLYDLKLQIPPRVIVGPAFYSIPLDAKQGFADTMNCFLMAGEDGYMNFDLYDYRTGHRVAKYWAGELTVEENVQ
jgi:hypothetical protein